MTGDFAQGSSLFDFVSEILTVSSPYVAIAGIVFVFIWSLGVLFSRRQYDSKRILLVVMLFSLLWLLQYLFFMKNAVAPSRFLFLNLFVLVFTGPVLYLFFRKRLLNEQVSRKNFILQMLLLSAFSGLVLKSDQLIDYGHVIHKQRLFFCFAGIVAFVYLLFPLRIILKSGDAGVSPVPKRIIALKISIIQATMLLTIGSLFANNIVFFSFTAVCFSGIIFVSYLFSEIWPGLLIDLGNELQKYQKSKLVNLDVIALKARVHQLVLEQKVYLEADLTLAKMASLLKVSPHQLSEYLNGHEGKKFSDFINQFRIDDAIKKLRENPVRPNMLNVAYSVGFESKTNFYRTFTKFTGKNPTQFILSHQPES